MNLTISEKVELAIFNLKLADYESYMRNTDIVFFSREKFNQFIIEKNKNLIIKNSFDMKFYDTVEPFYDFIRRKNEPNYVVYLRYNNSKSNIDFLIEDSCPF